MKVSVVIPFYSNIKWLEEAIESVLNQTLKDFEIIVINDGSSEDDTLFLKNYSHLIKYFKIANGGPAKARNKGIEIAKGEFIAFLDSDDIWLPSKLEKQIDLMQKNHLVWSHTKYEVFDEVRDKTERFFKVIENSSFKGTVFPKCLKRLHIATPCVIVRRDFFVSHKGIRFSENMRYGQDGFCWILISIDNDLGFIDEVLTQVRRLGGNAVQRARIHLNVRANLYRNLIKTNSFNVSWFLKLVYLYCFLCNVFLEKTFKDSYKNTFNIEMISKVLYFPAYIVFKIL